MAPFRLLGRSFLTALAMVVLTLPALAQATGSGTIRGKVQNATNGAYLKNVTVELSGSGQQVLTNDYGEFELRDVPAGEVTLKARYIGEPEQTATVSVTPDAVANRDFTFRESATTRRDKDGVIELDPYTVNVERYQNARAVAISEERSAINIKNVVSIDQFGDIPSNNVGEFVKFLPGIQIDYGASNNNNQGYSDSTANGVSIRGFGPDDTTIMIDGMPVASTVPGNLTRQVGLDQLAINNAQRVELIKVATPDMPANSLGGQINLVTRSAFEYAKPSYSARVFFNINSEHDEYFKKTPGPTNKDTYKTQPGVEFNITYPFSDKFGISFTAYAANEVTQGYLAQPVWNNNHAANFQNGQIIQADGTPSSISDPALFRYQISDGARIVETRSSNLKLDWKPTPSQVIRANVQYSTTNTAEGIRRLDFRPTIANGATWDEHQTIGTTANSTTAMTVTTRDRVGDTISGQIQYNLNWNGWTVHAGGSLSVSKSDFEDEANGHFSEVALNLNPGKVALYLGEYGLPYHAETFARSTGAAVDYTQLSNWVFDGTTAKSGQSHNETSIGLYKLDVERDLSFIPFLGSNNLTFKTGFRHDEEMQEKSGRGINYREILRPGASYTPGNILDETYVGQSPGFGLRPQQWASTYKLYELEQSSDIFYVPDFDEATNTRVENYNSFVGQMKKITESTDAWYAQLSGRFFKNRLAFVGGMRQETKTREGYSPFTDGKWDYLKKADGSLYTDAANPNGVQFSAGNGSVLNGVLITAPTNRPLYANNAAGTALRAALTSAGIAFPTVPYGPTTGANASLASRMLQYQPAREIHTKRKGDPSYSMSLAYNITKKIDLKVAWSRSFGLPKLEDADFGLISSNANFSINDFSSTEEGNNGGFLGEIKIANPNILPSSSDNWDTELSYYTDTGGKLSVSFYHKTVTNQPVTLTTSSGTATFDAVLPVLGLNPADYDNWRLATSTNANEEQITMGWEFEVRQDFGFLGGWGKNFQTFVSYAFTDLADPPTLAPVTISQPNGTPLTITPSGRFITKRANRFGGAGLQFSTRRFSAQIRGTYRNENEVALLSSTVINNNPIRRYQPPETRIDINLNYNITKTYSAFISARDVFNAQRKEVLIDDNGLIPDSRNIHSLRRFGTIWTVGVNGKW